jgi:hypothetical protein
VVFLLTSDLLNPKMPYPPTTLPPDEILDIVEDSFRKFALRDIQVLRNSNPPVPIAVFILCTCLIDQLSGFRYNSDMPRLRFIDFVEKYMPSYDAASLFKDLRNKLVHNYSVGEEAYVLSDQLSGFHLKPLDPVSKTKILDLSVFIADIEKAVDSYMKELRVNNECRNNAVQWYNKNRIFILSSLSTTQSP